jgi:hypothetical protein
MRVLVSSGKGANGAGYGATRGSPTPRKSDAPGAGRIEHPIYRSGRYKHIRTTLTRELG